MVLNHVADRARGIVIRTSPAGHAHFLGHGDLHRGNVPPVPDRFEDRVPQAEGQDVLDRFLAEVMVDPIDLVLTQHPRDVTIESAGTLEVVAERLLDDNPAPGAFLVLGIDQAGLAELFDDRREELGGDGEIEQPVSVRSVGMVERVELFFEMFVALGVIKGSRGEHDVAGEFGPELGEVGIVRVLETLFQLGAKLVVGPVAAGEADDGVFGGEVPSSKQVVECRGELAMRQVAGRAKQHHRTGIGNARPGQRLAEWIDLGRTG